MLKSFNAQRIASKFMCVLAAGLLPVWGLAQAPADPIAIGRSSLTLPDRENWKAEELDAVNIGLSGDVNMPLVMDTKKLTYRTDEKLIKAVFVARVTKGGAAGVSMTWANQCPAVKETSAVFKADNGTPSSIDCLVVMRVNQLDTFVNSRAPLKTVFGDAKPNTKSGYYIRYAKSMGAGGYAVSEALVADDFSGMAGELVKTQSTISPAILS